MRKAVKTMMGISSCQERCEKKLAELQKKVAELIQKRRQAYQELLAYRQKGDVAGERAAAKRYIIVEKIIQQYRFLIDTLIITQEACDPAVRIYYDLDELKKLKLVLEQRPSETSAEVESDIGKAKAEIAVPKAKVGLAEKEENAA
jgi:hypothetical protein